MSTETLVLPAGQILSVTAAAGSSGILRRLADVPGGGNSQGSAAVSSGATVTAGPFAAPARYAIEAQGSVTYSMALAEFVTDTELAAELAATGSGAAAGTNVVAAEYGDGIAHRTVLTLTATPITLTDEAGVGQYGSVKLYDFPAGLIRVHGAVLDVDLTLLSPFITTAAGDVGVGSTAVTDGDALATTEQDVIPTTEIAPLVARTGPANALATGAATLDGATSAAADLYLNVRIDDNASHATTADNLVSGTLTITWSNLGDL